MLSKFTPRLYYTEFYETQKITSNIVLYESRDGSAITDSPLALFLNLVIRPEFEELEHIWVVKNKENKKLLINIPVSLRHRLKLVERNSQEYVDYLLTAKYLITNSTFQSWFSKKAGQIYINTWHGTPLKQMGFDLENQVGNTQNVLRNLLMTDYFLSPNAHTTKIFRGSGYKLENLYSGEILETGYPRIDLTLQAQEHNKKQILKNIGLVLDNNLPNVIYMPTWRGGDTQNPSDSLSQLVAELEVLKQRFSGVFNILVKLHPYLYDRVKQHPGISSILIPDEVDTNIVLSETDILITDFSSVFFDYLVTDKPIIFYSWDEDIYNKERGLYMEQESLPGPVLSTIFEVADYLEALTYQETLYRKPYEAMKKAFVPYEDGAVSQRVVDYIFNQVTNEKLKVIKVKTDKKKLLFYPGNLANNGITRSFMNLTQALDYQKYDVTVFVNTPESLFLENYRRLNKNIRLIFRTGAPNFTQAEKKAHDRANSTGKIENIPIKAFQRETKRLLSGVTFDLAIDFSGYSFYWSKYIAFSDAKKKLIFQHNDLYEEMSKEVEGRYPHANLSGVFELYRYFDKVISVSEALKAVNAQKLAQYVGDKQLEVLPNLISLDQPPILLHGEEERVHLEGIYSFSNPTVEVYSQATSESVSKIFTVSKDSLVKVIASQDVKGNLRSKILIDDIYYGWVEHSQLKFSGNDIIHEKKATKVASLIKKKNFLIYRTMPDFSPDKREEAIVESKDVKQYYWFVKKVVETRQGKLAYISNMVGINGWIDEKALTRFHSIKNKPHLTLGFMIHNLRNRKVVTEKISFEKFSFKIKKEMQFIYTRPEPLEFSKKTSALAFDRQLDYTTDEQQRFKGQTWVKTYQNTKFIGWIKSSDIQKEVALSNFESNKNPLEKEIKQIKTYQKEGIPQFVNVARLSPEKNQKLLLEAFNELIKSGIKAKLYILGTGALEEELRAKIIELNLTNEVKLLGQVENVSTVLKYMDYFVFPSLYEGQGMALLEAMALGLLPITSDIPTSREILKEGYYGIIYKSNDKEELLKAMRQALRQKNSYPKFDLDTYNKKVKEKLQIILEK
ncbi:CDP-glycerol glycerophosphotransferase family protein [Lactococcus formosensis subsp. bovis]|uniref:CDP-glycerol glycerophosphotransferase family protein n=1 Tax=Lactococcus formosensis TaxID=1281486 RepID=UPI0002E229CC